MPVPGRLDRRAPCTMGETLASHRYRGKSLQVKSMETVRMETRVRVRVSVCLLVSIGLPLTPHMPVRCPSHLKAPRQPPRTHMALVLAEHPAKSRRARRRNSSGNLGKSRMHAHVTIVCARLRFSRAQSRLAHTHTSHTGY